MKLSENAVLAYMQRKGYRPQSIDDLCRSLKIPRKSRKRFRRIIKALGQAKKIIRTSNRCYRAIQETDFLDGKLRKHRDGFGFLICDDPSEEDIYISRQELMGIMDGDRLRVIKVEGRRGKRGESRSSAQVIKIIERGKKRVVGILQVRGRLACVIPQKSGAFFGGSESIAIPFSKHVQLMKNQMVVCDIVKYPRFRRPAEGKIVKVLGQMGKPDVDFSVMVHQYELPYKFSLPVLKEADALEKRDLKEEIARRKDLRDVPLMTIDGETAKDFDDAVYVKKGANGNYRLWVAIADVSFFVKSHSKLDQEAYERATSTYFPGGVIPMLPEVLSNNLCSLRPNELKMSFCCEMEFNKKGERTDFSIYEAVMESRYRMTYTAVQAILDGDRKTRDQYKKIVSDIETMNELKEILRVSRLARGCLDFDLPEPELVLNLQGRIEDIVKRPRLDAHMLIEEFMIAANETVAEFMFDRERPFIYRIHDEPDEDMLVQFEQLAHNLGFPVKHQKEIHPKVYSDVLERVQGDPSEHVLNDALLRSMKQAVYSEENHGHFGLASECYSHFTSPIRRYPDLIVHRLLKQELKKRGKSSDTDDAKLNDQLGQQAAHCSKQERVVEEAEREFVALKKCQFMEDKIDDEYIGYISGVKEFGFFVELEKFYIEGLVPMRSLEGDQYQFMPQHYVIRGRRHGTEFHLGQKVLVRVVEVDIDRREIDFELLESFEE